MSPRFEWDGEKAESNVSKHAVSFNEARTVLDDPLSITIADPEHSEAEQRFIDIGLSSHGRLIVVSYTERGEALRIISARLATRRERQWYEQ